MDTFLGSVAMAFRDALYPLAAALENEGAFVGLVRRFGWDLGIDPSAMPPPFLQDHHSGSTPHSPVPPPYAAIGSGAITGIRSAFDLLDLFQTINDVVVELEDPATDELSTAQRLIEVLADLVDAINSISHVGTATTFPLDQDAFWQQMREDLLDFLLIQYFERAQPVVLGVLLLTGVAEVSEEQPTALGRIPYTRFRLHWDQLGRVVGDPVGWIRDVYHWGDANQPFEHVQLIATLSRFFQLLQLPSRTETPRPSLASHYYGSNPHLADVRELVLPIYSFATAGWQQYIEVGILMLPIPPLPAPNSSQAPVGLMLGPLVTGSFDNIPESAEDESDFSLEVSATFQSESAVGIEARPGEVTLRIDPGETNINARIVVTGRPEQPWLLVGGQNSARIELGGLHAALAVRGAVADPEIIVELGTGVEPDPPKLAVVIEFADADGFLQKIIGSQPIRLEAAVGLQWSSKRGLSFSGGAGIIRDIPINKTLGFIRIDTLTVGLMASTSGGVDIIAALTGNAKLGPVSATAEKVGVKLELVEPQPNEVGLFGSLDLAFGFKPPDGLGISIDAGPVTGGGFLSIDHANGRYAGVLQLQLASIGVTAIGLLDTKLPSGQQGFSFLLIITFNFPPIQLGFGFTLNGVGGLVGINRTIIVEALQAGVRSKAIDHVLFPVDPVGNATQLFSNLRTFFPPSEGRYVFGPMAIIGWGTPEPMIEVELGIILEIPDPVRLVLLGQINATIPHKRAAIIELHLDILGIIDFGGKQLSIDASLHNSRVAVFELYGDMALRLNWGSQPNFAFAVGGFNPHFQAPPGFPELRRLTLALGSGANPRISLQAYLAITSNSFQVGARADLYAAAAGFSITGWAGFDALFIFNPFSFRVDIFAGMALRRGTTTLAGISVEASLSGPAPWHVWGKGCLQFLFIEICVGFDATFGPRPEAQPRPAIDVWSVLRPAISDPRNWTAELPPASARAVSIGLPTGTNASNLFDPIGTATLRQKEVPLNRDLTRFGESDISGPNRFDLSGVAIGGTATGWTLVTDYFAEAQFEDMSDAEKLSRPSFTLMDAGVSAGIDKDVLSAVGFAQEATYKTIVVDDPERPWLWQLNTVAIPMLVEDLLAQAAVGVASVSPLHHSGLATYMPPLGSPQAVALAEASFTIVSGDTLEVLPDLPEHMTKGEAYRVMKAHLANNPGARGTVQVVPSAELAV